MVSGVLDPFGILGFSNFFLITAVGGFRLAGCLVLGEIKFFLNLTLAPGQFLKAFLALKLRADFFAKLFDALVGIGDVQLQSFRAFFKSLNRRFQRTNGAKRRVRDPRAVTVLAAQDHFSGVVEARTHEQIKTGEAPDADVLAKPRLQFFRAAHNQFARNAPVVGFLPVEFNPEIFTSRLANLRQDLGVRQDTSGDKFRIELDGQESNNRGIAGELILRRAEKLKARFGEDVRSGKFAGFDLFMRPSFNNTTEMVLRGQNSYGARVTDTALGTIRSLEATVQGFEERAERLELDITDANKRVKELGEKVGAKFEREERFQELTRRQSEIEEKLDLTKNQAPSQAEAADGGNEEKIAETQNSKRVKHPRHHVSVTV